jgi:hypothetical protein
VANNKTLMIENYTFTLKNNKNKLLKRVTWIWYFVLLGLIVLFAFSENVTEKEQRRLLLRLGILIIAGILTYFNKEKKDTLKGFQAAVFFFSLMSIYSFFGIYFTICFVLFSAFIFWFVHQNTIISFNEESILVKNGFFRRIVDWASLNNVVLKDGILTLDFKNDKLIQEEVEGGMANETAFNLFVRNKLQ